MRVGLFLFGCVVCSGLFAGVAASEEPQGAENLKAAAIGEWVSASDEQNPFELLKDGTAKVGFIRENGKWVIATGTWTISDKGRVTCKTTYNGITWEPHWTLKDGALVGPLGPKPAVTWTKVKKDNDKK